MSPPRNHDSAGPGSRSTAPRRRGCFGCVFSGGAGCLAFAVGSLVAAMLFAPSLLGGSAARFLERAFGQELAGRLELERVNLAWRETQAVEGLRLFDEEGVELLSGRVLLPGILSWEEDGEPLEVQVELSDLLVHRDASGESSLARALGGSQGSWPEERLDLEFGEFRSARGLDQTFPYDLLVEAGQVRWLDERRPNFLLRLRTLRARFLRRLDGELAVRVTGIASLGEVEGPFTIDWNRMPGQAATGSIVAEGLPSAALEGLAGDLCHLPLLCGPRLELEADLTTLDGGGRRVSGALVGGEGRADFDLAWDGQALSLTEGGLLSVASDAVEPWIEVTGLAAAGLRTAGPDAGWSAKASALEWPLWNAPGAARSIELEGALGGPLLLGTTGGLSVSDVTLRLAHGPAGPRVFEAEGRCGEGELRLLIEGAGASCLPLCGRDDRYSLSGAGVAGGELDAWLGADGLVAGLAAGPMAFSMEGPGGDAGEMRRASHVLQLRGPELSLPPLELRDGVVRMSTPAQAPATLPLVARVCAGVLEPALPLLQSTRPLGSTLEARAEDLEFRLESGRLHYLSGELELAPDELEVALHPGFAALFEADPPSEPVAMALLPIRVRIDGDTLHYLDLDLPLAGEDCDLAGGKIARTTGELDFEVRSTLRVAAHQLKLPAAARALVVESDYTVAMQIVGPLDDPDLQFSAEVLAEFMNGGVRRLLKDTPLPLLESGLERLLLGSEDR